MTRKTRIQRRWWVDANGNPMCQGKCPQDFFRPVFFPQQKWQLWFPNKHGGRGDVLFSNILDGLSFLWKLESDVDHGRELESDVVVCEWKILVEQAGFFDELLEGTHYVVLMMIGDHPRFQNFVWSFARITVMVIDSSVSSLSLPPCSDLATFQRRISCQVTSCVCFAQF